MNFNTLRPKESLRITLTPDQLREGGRLADQVFAEHTAPVTNPEHAEYVRQMRERDAASPGGEVPRLFEAAFIDCIANYKWLGDNVVIKRSEYDDLRHGVDATAALTDANGNVLLAFSFDMTTNRDALSKKMGRIKFAMQHSLATVTYTGMDDIGFKGEQTGVPHFLISASGERIQRLITGWIEAKRSGSSNIVETNLTRYVTIAELYRQCEVFLEHARKNDYRLAVERYEKALRAITPLYRAMPSDIRNDLEQSPKTYDHMYENLILVLNGFSTLPEVDPALGKSGVRGAAIEEDARPVVRTTSGTVMQTKTGKSVEVAVKKKRKIPGA